MKLTNADHIQGSPSAPIILVEYADFQCPYCGQAYTIVKKLQKKFGNKMAFVFRNFPLTNIHRFALHAAIAAEAADKQGKFWEMHDILFDNQRHLDDASILEYAEEVGLDVEKFKDDFNSGVAISRIEKDLESGERAGVQGTPSFFINGRFFDGDWTNSEFGEYLEALIK